MMNDIKRLVAPLLAVAILVATAVFCGCRKDAPAVQPASAFRGKDAAYREQLAASVARQKQARGVQARTAEQMRVYISRARKALPAGATDEQVQRELDANPAKYPGWKDLQEAFRAAETRHEAELADLRRTVRRRIMKEAADQKAAAQGTAGATPAPKK